LQPIVCRLKLQCGLRQVKKEPNFSRSFYLTFEYGSDNQYQGRSAGDKQAYFSPSLTYEASSGFFTSFSADRLLKPYNSWEERDFTLGWTFKLSKRLDLFMSYTHMNFKEESVLLRSSLSNNLEAMLLRNSKYLTSRLYFDFSFGKGKTPNDYNITFENSHDFIFENLFTKDNDALKIKPLVILRAGTLNFYKFHLKNPLERPSLRNLAVDVNTKFNFTGLELLLPVEYQIGRFSFEPAIHYSIPLNQPKIYDASPKTYFTCSISFFFI
jgi:hypothetical protein